MTAGAVFANSSANMVSLQRLNIALDERILRKGAKDPNQTNHKMRLIVLIAVSTGMRSAEIHRLRRSDVRYGEGSLAVRAKLKKGQERSVPTTSEFAEGIRRYPTVRGDILKVVIGVDVDEQAQEHPRLFGAERCRGSFDDALEVADTSLAQFLAPGLFCFVLLLLTFKLRFAVVFLALLFGLVFRHALFVFSLPLCCFFLRLIWILDIER
jgi:Phage integrase family